VRFIISGSIARVLTDSFFSSYTLSGLWNPYGIAVDSKEGLLFWTDDGYDHLVRFDMKKNEQIIIASGLSSPADVLLIQLKEWSTGLIMDFQLSADVMSGEALQKPC
jgi:hypothetical protein